jgi:hypothetical protein
MANEKNSHEDPELIADELRVEAQKRKRRNVKKMNNWWLWLGVLILIFILVWWLWTIGIFGDVTGSFNG